jgi:hypothetical protein
MNALVYIKSSWPTIRGDAAMFIGKVLKASRNPKKGPRKNREAPHVTVYTYPHIYIYIYIYIYNIKTSIWPSLPPCLSQTVLYKSHVLTTKRCNFLDGQLGENCWYFSVSKYFCISYRNYHFYQVVHHKYKKSSPWWDICGKISDFSVSIR